jgi:arsenate reductase-like glutaredoxin family protein
MNLSTGWNHNQQIEHEESFLRNVQADHDALIRIDEDDEPPLTIDDPEQLMTPEELKAFYESLPEDANRHFPTEEEYWKSLMGNQAITIDDAQTFYENNNFLF